MVVVVNVGRNLCACIGHRAGLLNSTVCAAAGGFSCVDGSLEGFVGTVQHVVRAIPGRYQNVERFSGSLVVYVDRAVVTRDYYSSLHTQEKILKQDVRYAAGLQ